MYDLAAYSSLGLAAPGFPKRTGGWSVSTPGVGDMDGDGRLELALATREGNLFVWRTRGSTCQATEWPKSGHDLRNTSTYGVDAERPGVVGGATVRPDGTVSWAGTGDDGACGTAASYRVSAGGSVVEVAGTTAALTIPAGAAAVEIRAIDDAGNVGAPAVVALAASPAVPAAVAAAPTSLPATGDTMPVVLLAVVALLTLVLRRRLTP
jgi:hypothetical protein